MARRGLSVEVSDLSLDRFDGMEQTYRDEGISVSERSLRVQGTDIQLNVSYADLELGTRIGQGACSSVCQARHRITGKKYAVKMFNVYDTRQAEQLKKEIIMLTKLDACDALISLEGMYHNEGVVGMVLEYMDRGSLEYFLKTDNDMPEYVLAAIAFQILWGLGYLHFEKRLHRDVKPANVLFSSDGWVKLSDFGISKELGSTDSMSNTSIGTCRYMSPERLLGRQYDASGDVWSVGIMLIELWHRRYPFETSCSTPVDLLSELETFTLSSLTSDMPVAMAELIADMLVKEASRRADCQQLIGSRWFADCGVFDLLSARRIVSHWLELIEQGEGVSVGGTRQVSKNIRGGGGMSMGGKQMHHHQSRGGAGGAHSRLPHRKLQPSVWDEEEGGEEEGSYRDMLASDRFDDAKSSSYRDDYDVPKWEKVDGNDYDYKDDSSRSFQTFDSLDSFDNSGMVLGGGISLRRRYI